MKARLLYIFHLFHRRDPGSFDSRMRALPQLLNGILRGPSSWCLKVRGGIVRVKGSKGEDSSNGIRGRKSIGTDKKVNTVNTRTHCSHCAHLDTASSSSRSR
jgi:hypothetical protein